MNRKLDQSSSVLIRQALIVFVFSFIILFNTSKQIGMIWDEPFEIVASESYLHWYKELFTTPQDSLSSRTIDQYWTIGNEHPPVDKIWSGLIWMLTKCFLDDLTAHRLGNMILSSALLAFVYLWGAELIDKRAGAFAALTLLTLPRFFFHMHLTTLDVPVTTLIFIFTYFFWRAAEVIGSLKNPFTRKVNVNNLVFYLAFALAISTKVNAVFIPFIIGIWVLIFHRQPQVFGRMALMGIISLLTYIAVWPWFYHDTSARLLRNIFFILNGHTAHGQWYMGQYFSQAPWHFPFAILIVTVPLTTLILFIVGVFSLGKNKPALALILFNIFIPLLIFAGGGSPMYDNERLLMQVFPFVALAAGAGFGSVAEKLQRFSSALKSTGMAYLLASILISPQVISSVSLYPHLLSYYSEIIGGVRGATKLGFETTYWGETYADAIPYINQHAKAGDSIWVEPWSMFSLIYYQKQGYLRHDLLFSVPFEANTIYGYYPNFIIRDHQDSDWIIFQNRQSMAGNEFVHYSDLLVYLKEKTPVFQVQKQGILLMGLYSR